MNKTKTGSTNDAIDRYCIEVANLTKTKHVSNETKVFVMKKLEILYKLLYKINYELDLFNSVGNEKRKK